MYYCYFRPLDLVSIHASGFAHAIPYPGMFGPHLPTPVFFPYQINPSYHGGLAKMLLLMANFSISGCQGGPALILSHWTFSHFWYSAPNYSFLEVCLPYQIINSLRCFQYLCIPGVSSHRCEPSQQQVVLNKYFLNYFLSWPRRGCFDYYLIQCFLLYFSITQVFLFCNHLCFQRQNIFNITRHFEKMFKYYWYAPTNVNKYLVLFINNAIKQKLF